MATFPGVDEIRIDARGFSVVHFDIDYTDSSATFTVPVKAGTFVHDVGTFVKTAFDGSTPSLTIGDGDSAHGYLDTADTAIGTIDTATTSASAGSEAYARGKYYASDDTIDFTFVAAATATAGRVIGYVVMSHTMNDGLAA